MVYAKVVLQRKTATQSSPKENETTSPANSITDRTHLRMTLVDSSSTLAMARLVEEHDTELLQSWDEYFDG